MGTQPQAEWAFQPYAPGFDADPHGELAFLRERFPVYHWAQGNAWLLSRHEDCVEVLRDERFSLNSADWKQGPAFARTSIDELYEGGLFGLTRDAHLRVRRLISPSFTPRAIGRRREEIEAIVAEALDEIGDAPSFDLIPQLADLVPVRTISRMLGIPRAHEAQFRGFASAVVAGVTPVLRATLSAEAVESIRKGQEFIQRVIDERRGAPQDDLISELIRVEEQGDRLSTHELLALITSLVIAGTETTTHLIAFGVVNLLRHPRERARLAAEPERIAGAIDEVLRFDLFSRLGVPRFALEPLEIRGVRIERGEMVMPLLTAALRDPRAFPEPDRFDIGRDQKNNIAFGMGAHSCVGAALARLEGTVTLARTFERYPDLELADEPTFAFHPILRCAKSIPLRRSRAS